MTGPMIVWASVIAVMIGAFLVRAVEKTHIAPRFKKRRHRIIEIGEESEMFYCPGDKVDEDQ